MFRLFIISFLFPCLANALCVKSSTANLRQGPGTNYAKSWKVYKYMPFRKLARKGSWYKVMDVDGYVHWIHRSLVTNKYLCAVIKKDKANLRTGPGVTYKKNSIWSQAPKYSSFRYEKTKKKWAYVKDSENIKYWIYRSLLWIQ